MKQLLVFLLLLCSASVSAQDVIVKKDGSTILCRVVEVTSTEITYKKWDNLNGSNYVMDKSLASAINYQNGKKVTLSETANIYTPHNQNDGTQQYNDRALLKMDYDAQNVEKKINTLKKTSWIGGITGVGLGAIFLCLASKPGVNDNDGNQYIIGGVSCFAGVACFTTCQLLANHYQKKKFQFQAQQLYHFDYKFDNGSLLSTGVDLMSDCVHGSSTIGLGLRYNF